MAEHPNVALVRKGFDAFGTGDMATLGTLFADGITWHAAGRSILAGDFVGKEAVFGNFGRFVQVADSFKQDVHTILADDTHAVALVNTTITRGGKTAIQRQTIVFHLAGGKVTEAWFSSYDQYAADEFWA
jgi:ketosteroid isomerase-like protein